MAVKLMEIKEGLTITANGVTGTIVDVHKLDDCTLFSLDIKGYGVSQPFVAHGHLIGVEAEDQRKTFSGIPNEYYYKYAKDFRFDLYGVDMADQKKTVNDYVINFQERYLKTGNGLYIYSKEKGTGKTMLACCIGNELIKRLDKNVKYVTAPDYIEHCIAKRTELIQKYKNCAVLILDDLGAESTGKKDDWVKSVIFSLVDWRYKNHLSTIFTSNYDYPELTEDSRTIDRIVSSNIKLPIPDVQIRRMEGKKYMDSFTASRTVDEDAAVFK